ncbi:dethiobiotin synthase [Candidatus Purcelliella pentastirinorum]|uniref:dethiobiotin synthase n=1 Tax=Candidatus Purcelliella pentastirinorum TaxID=472834 RepID=UPI00237C068A|nr:dethiobiotin synthase [Candidatus Purcelliella pentastirinorum]WDR80496.1 dethiobiotin synthase [Candidatus Purcelliella pentastirinorum]
MNIIKKIFITGTDTNIGKTFISKIILIKANKLGYKTGGYKPIATGCIKTKSGLINNDVITLQKYSNTILSYKEINPYSFKFPTSPNIANKNNIYNITIKNISRGLSNICKKANFIIIEGVGGWYTPISNNITMADWVMHEKLPVILVIGIKLGCINHALLTIKAIKKNKLNLIGWITNNLKKKNKFNKNYINTLKNMIKKPLLGEIPYIHNNNKLEINKIKLKLPI